MYKPLMVEELCRGKYLRKGERAERRRAKQPRFIVPSPHLRKFGVGQIQEFTLHLMGERRGTRLSALLQHRRQGDGERHRGAKGVLESATVLTAC